MIRQAHTYLVGAMSGATLIAIAIAAFVLLVSAQVFRDWPIAALGSGDGGAEVSEARPAPGSPGGARDPGPAAANGQATSATGGAGAAAKGNGRSGAVGAGPTATIEGESGGGNTVVGGGGGQGGSSPSAPAGSPGSPDPAAPETSGGGGSGSGGGSTTSPPSTAGKVTETANDAVSQVDTTVTGGALQDSGVTPATEGVVNGVAGPESPVGRVVDETVNSVGGILGGTP
jgi:hypothetical protein